MQYYLQNTSAGYCGNAPYWWAENDCGYTIEIDKAKLFTNTEASLIIKTTKKSHKFRKWRQDKVSKAITKTIDIQKLHK